MDRFEMKPRDSGTFPHFNHFDGFVAQFTDRNDFHSRQTHDEQLPKWAPGIVERWIPDQNASRAQSSGQ
jgi:hypothetical protein